MKHKWKDDETLIFENSVNFSFIFCRCPLLIRSTDFFSTFSLALYRDPLKGNTLSISVLAAKDMRHNVFNLLVKSSEPYFFTSHDWNIHAVWWILLCQNFLETFFCQTEVHRTDNDMYTLGCPPSRDVLLNSFDMFCRPLGWYCSYCAAPLVTGTSERKHCKTSRLSGRPRL